MHVRYIARSDAGRDRDGNEDAGIAGPHVLAVADGMGGHAAGELASHAAIDELASSSSPSADPLDELSALLAAANERIRLLAAESPARQGMGTTVTALIASGNGLEGQVALGHIGDSRAYMFHEGVLRQLTHDHTFVQTLVDDGQITPEQARSHPARSVVLKALQGQDVVEADLSLVPVQEGDRLLVCSDGLTDVVPDDVIAHALASAPGVDDAADELIRLGLAEGGPDNITVVVADLTDEPPAEPEPPLYLVGAAGPT